MRRLLLYVLLLGLAGAARAASVTQLLDRPVQNERGAPAGTVTELIVDVEAGRVLYLVLDAGERFRTLPVRALGEDLRLDLDDAGEMVRPDGEDDARFRRASALIGDRVTHAHPGGATHVGTIRDIEFDPDSGRIENVIVSTPQGALGVGAAVLAQGRFPPLDPPQGRYATREELGERGWLRGEPSDERRRLHEHQFR
jgi:sporulation protein YlmC with PRC-barrel domain